MLHAITRQVSRAITRCELTHLPRQPIDLETARHQHHAYLEALRSLGVQVTLLPEQPRLPDSVFVEDTAIVLDECAVLTRPGARSRRPEVTSIARALAPHRPLQRITAPATLDGGDVLVAGRQVWVGLSTLSQGEAVAQLAALLAPWGYTVGAVPLSGCLHLKSAVTLAAPGLLLINPAWVQPAHFPGMDLIAVHADEPAAANLLRVGETVLCQPAHPRTNARLRAAGLILLEVDASELAKAEGALTCCALLFAGKG